MQSLLTSSLLGLLLALPGFAGEPSPSRLRWGDQGDGTFANPVLKADYSDPDVIRVGSDFYLVASEFHFMGMQVLHSRDLVNWRLLSQIYGRLDFHPRYSEMRGYAQGTWAPSLRYHDGVFYLFVCTPHDGLFQWHATDPAGPWSGPVTVKAVDSWEDPCPFWDDDGQAYLVHSKLRAGPLILHKMSADGTRLLDDGVEIYRGPVAEGPKLFKRNGDYYISLPEGGVSEGGQTVLRAKSIYGPYERRQVLENQSPHQGALVDLENGDSWFMGFQSTSFLGRVCHLLPVRWGEDGWPVFGDEGRTVVAARKPRVAHGEPFPFRPACNDDFDTSSLGLHWQWNHNPLADAWSLVERPGWLRLQARPAADLASARNTLTQKLWDEAGLIDVLLDATRLAEGQSAGLTFMSGHAFGALVVKRENNRLTLTAPGGAAHALSAPVLWLRCRHEGDAASYAFGTDGREFSPLSGSFQLKAGDWKGARIALFCFGPGDGWADFDRFRYRYAATLADLEP